MTCWNCLTSGGGVSRFSVGFAALSRGAAKAAGARLRQVGATTVAPGWLARDRVCQGCPLRVVRNGVAYCGEPLRRRLVRVPALHGCGCPIQDKARAPGEHCPLSVSGSASTRTSRHCDCKWCADSATTVVTNRRQSY